MKTALVAGAAGFIASHLCDLLLDCGYRVIGVDSLVTGRAKNLKSVIDRGLILLEHDIRDGQLLKEISGGPIDEIYNLASPASPVDFPKMPAFILETASAGHKNLLDLAHARNARILFASSSEVYGDPEVHPQVESYFGNVNPIGPRSCYDEAKRYGEALNMAYQREFKVETRTARIFNTYGPRMRPNDGRIIPNFFIQALQRQPLSVYGDGSQTRSFCFVSDLVKGLHALMTSDQNLPTNVGNPIERSVLDVASLINDLTGNPTKVRHLPLPENDPKLRRPDISRMQAATGWQPEVSLETGLKESMAYFEAELRAASGRIETPVL